MAAVNAGYSGKPVAQKLGVRPGQTIVAVNAPDDYAGILGALPAGVTITRAPTPASRLIHAFVTSRAALESLFPTLKQHLAPDGMLWISWPKRASKAATDLDENVVREIGLQHGLVDVKVVAIDATWSGLKFVYRLADRA